MDDAYYLRAPGHTSVLGFMSVYQIFRYCQCLNDLRIWAYDLGVLTSGVSGEFFIQSLVIFYLFFIHLFFIFISFFIYLSFVNFAQKFLYANSVDPNLPRVRRHNLICTISQETGV